MIDSAVFLIGAYGAMAAGLSATVAKVSPTIGPRLRHLFSGAAPLAAVLAARLDGASSVTLDGELCLVFVDGELPHRMIDDWGIVVVDNDN